MTVRIALCDDEMAELEKTEELLSAYEDEHPGSDFIIRCFAETDELLMTVRENTFLPDLIFMDICMPDEEGQTMSLGMAAAKELRKMGNEAALYFLTSSREYAVEAFDVEASGYLVKPVSEEKLCSLLDKFQKEREQRQKKYILLKQDGRLLKVSLDDILYCEAQGKRQSIHLKDGTELFQNLTMAKIGEMFAGWQEFVKIGASYIINLEHIDSLTASEVQMDNGQKIYPPRGTYRCLREQYFDYYCPNEI